MFYGCLLKQQASLTILQTQGQLLYVLKSFNTYVIETMQRYFV